MRNPAARGERRSRRAEAPETAGDDWWWGRLQWGLAIAAGLLAFGVYANSLSNGFVWDDSIILTRQLPVFRTWRQVLFTPPDIPQFSPDYYRPLVVATYLLDQRLWGGSPAGFHLTVVLAHSLTSAAVFFLALALFRGAQRGGAARPSGYAAHAGALAAAALFAVHPIHTEAVAWVAGRGDVMATLFGVVAAIAHLRSRRRPAWSAVAGLAALPALLAKEVAVALVAILPAWDWLVGRGERTPVSVGRASCGAPAGEPPGLLLRYAPLVAALAVYSGLRLSVVGSGVRSEATLGVPGLGSIVAAVGTYLWKLCVPMRLNAYIAAVPSQPWALAGGAAAVIGLVVLGVWGARRGGRDVPAALLWVGAGLVPSLLILVKLPEVPIAERYLYFPSVGFCLLGGRLVALGVARERVSRLATAALLLLVLGGWAVNTVHRNRVWRDDRSLWTDTSTKSPGAGLPFRSLAVVLQKEGHFAQAEAMYRVALEKDNTPGGKITIYNNLGSLVLARGDLSEAERYYRQALAIAPLPDCLFNLGYIDLTRALEAGRGGDAGAKRSRAGAALGLLRRAEEGSPHDPDIQAAIGQSLFLLDKPREARRRYERALALGASGETAEQIRRVLAEPAS